MKVNYSLLHWGFTLPKRLIKEFEGDTKIKTGTHRRIKIKWRGKVYSAKFYNKNTWAGERYQFIWSDNSELLEKLRTTFIQSYLTLVSKKELESKKPGFKHFRTNLPAGQQEVLIIKPINETEFEFEVFIRIKHPLNALFERLTKENVFGWLFSPEKDYLISKSTTWMDIKKLKYHTEASNVIYFLSDTKNKELYIGSARKLGKRVKPSRSEIKGWDRFRYDIIKPQFSPLLRRIEFHTIRAVASLLENKKNSSSLKLSSYKLVNKNWSLR